MMLTSALTALALAGEPECPVSLTGCYYTYSEAKFGNPWFSMYSAYKPYNESITGSTKTHACKKYNWLMREQCHIDCPLRLSITRPEHLKMNVCVQDNVFSPYEEEAHVSKTHKLNGVELELVAPGGTGSVQRHGCVDPDFQNDTRGVEVFDGKMVLVQRGTCYFYQKFDVASRAGGAAGLMINTRTFNSIYDQMFSMSGPSGGFKEFPAAMIPSQYGEVLLEALDRGEKVYGRYELNCNPVREPTEEEIAMDDGCPTGKLEEACLDVEEEEDRLCSACPAQIDINGVTGCLRGNFLLPRKKENYFQHSPTFGAFPVTSASDEVVFVTSMTSNGCQPSDWAGMEGKIVMVYNPATCPYFQAARYASAAKVKAFINYHLSPGGIHDGVEGVSNFVDVPTHSLDGDDSILLKAEAEKVGTAFDIGHAKGFKLQATFDVGPTRARPPKVEKVQIVMNEAAAPEAIAAWKWTPAAVVSLILIIFFFFALVMLHLHQRANAVEIPSSDDDVKEGFALPLGLANMGIALSLLVIIAVVAFMLAYQAGQDATDTAVKDGNKAASITYENAVGNVNELANSLRTSVIGKVQQGVRSTLSSGEYAANGVAQLYIGFDGSWASFSSMLQLFINYAVSVESTWLCQIYTTRGFYASRNFITDDRADSLRQDGVNGSVAETNKGWLYGTNSIWYASSTMLYYFWANNHRLEFNASRMLGGHFGDPLAQSEGNPRYYYKWHITKESFANLEEYQVQPISVFTPLRNRAGTWLGTIEARTPLTTIGSLVSQAASGEGLQNLTLALFDPEDKMVIATNAWYNIKKRGQVRRVGWREMRGYFTLYDLPPVHVSAATHFIDSKLGRGTWDVKGDSSIGKEPGFSDLFDQAQYYKGTPLTVMKIRPVNGVAKDVGGDEWDPEMMGGACGACVSADGSHFELDGDSTLFLKKNLTRRVPMIAETQVPTADGSWKSNKYDFETEADVYGTGEKCIAYDDVVDDTQSTMYCLLRENFLASVGYTQEGYTVSMRVKPAVDYDEANWGVDTPHLFTDRTLGETNFRLFANGELNMWILGYGCKTKAPAGGIKAGVWTTVTATRGPGYCAVYIDGELVSWGQVASGYYTIETSEPYVVGRRYKGAIDNFNVYNFSVSSSEAKSIHESATGDFTRDIDSRMWYADVRSVDENHGSREGVSWQVLAMLPRDDVMRQVDRNNDITMRNLRVQEDNTQKRLTQKNNETIMIVVVIALASVFVFLIFNDALTKPFAQTAIVMTDAAVMRIEQVDEKHSFLLELNAMNRAMALMCKNLKEFKSYMPQTLGLDDESDDEESEASVKSKSKSRKSGKSMASFMSKNAAASQAAETAMAANEKRKGLTLALQRKKISFCINNVSGWFHGTQSMSESATVALHGEILALTLQSFVVNKGVSEVFSGDRFVASFNAAKNCGTHRTAAVAAGHQINTEFMKRHGEKFQMHTACVSGDGRVGNCGNDQMKKYTFMTPVLTWGYGLERIAKAENVPIIVDSYIYDDASNTFTVKVLMDVQFNKRNKNKCVRVGQVVGRKEGGDSDEWMYELEEAAAKDPYAKWNKFVDAVLGQDWEAAAAMRGDAEELDKGPDFQRLTAQLDSQRVSPLELKFH